MTKDEKILHELYRRSFAASTPKGDWDELLTHSPINGNGVIEIPFMDYEIDGNLLDEIFLSTLKEFKVPERRHFMFSFEFYLGCSPKAKR